MRIGLALMGLVLAVALSSADAARSAYPGMNGKIVFVSNRGGGGYALYTMKPSGAAVAQITPKAARVKQPCWSPDGTRIVYVLNSRITIVNADGSGATGIGPTGGVAFPTWSPDGTKIAFGWNDGIAVMNADGSAVTVIRADEGAGDYSKWEPSWSSVGSKIVYVEGNGESSGGIWSMSSAGAGAHALTPYGGDTNIDSAPDWSPSATKIAFQRYVDCSGGSCKNAVYVMNANGTGAHLVKKGASFPSWSPAGNKIAFVRRMGGSTEIFSMNTNGSSLKRLTNNGASDFSPDWAPSP